ncbi:hypothetical protein HPP92_007474 [Vanilla planifolia]|uniref:BHLH domain-containing protein n=1 Tax=Vanilla planifolia TaxID=51239 RepID=A0A835V8R3_VANPL|nr:hypothetical protein HPP92_007474 [Vanilla planifolia]
MMYGSVTGVAKELNYPFPAMAFGRRKEETEHQRAQQLSSGLLRYRSAPGSLSGEICEEFHPLRPSSPETEAIFSHLLSPELHGEKPAGSDGRKNPNLHHPYSAAAVDHREALLPSQMLYNSKVQQMTENAGGDSNLIRQGSSPSGLFCCLKGDSGYGLTSQISFSSRRNALSLISDVDSNGFSGGRHSERQEKCGGSSRLYVPGCPISSEESSLISGNLPETSSAGGLKRGRSMDGAAGKNQTDYHNNAEQMRPQISGIVHQLGLPKTSSEIAVLEKLLQFQDAVPCKIRAKRGCATHPRSIAERVRRTRISERMKKLQELVPNMDKLQTNTSDMLDLAIEYIKDLQRQIKSLKESGERCSCLSSKQRFCQNFES